MNNLDELYQEVILDHGKNPRNFNTPDDPTNKALGNNPLCGDQLTVYLKVNSGVVEDVAFIGRGCAISIASASMMTEFIKGKSEDEIKQIFNKFHEMCTEDASDKSTIEELEKLQVLSGVREFPTRVKCATLPWHTLLAALAGEKEVTTE